MNIEPWFQMDWMGLGHSRWSEFIDIGVLPIITLWGIIWITKGFKSKERQSHKSSSKPISSSSSQINHSVLEKVESHYGKSVPSAASATNKYPFVLTPGELKDLAERGDHDSMCKLGYCYEMGMKVEKDLQRANYWYERAAEGEVDAS